MSIDDEKLRLWLEAAVESAFRAGAAEERAAVVAWLRDKGHAWVNAEVVMLADFIERGEHRREEE